jgi:hypothetical protein
MSSACADGSVSTGRLRHHAPATGPLLAPGPELDLDQVEAPARFVVAQNPAPGDR